MSPERLALDSQPCAARISQAASLEAVLDARVADLCSAARAEGRSEALAQRLARTADGLDRASAVLAAAQDAALAEVGRLAIKLATEIARKILRSELPGRGYDIEGMVRETLATAKVGRGACVVHLHPDDVAALADRSFRTNTKLESDPDLALGDVHVETPQGLLVRDTEELLASIEESLLESLSE